MIKSVLIGADVTQLDMCLIKVGTLYTVGLRRHEDHLFLMLSEENDYVKFNGLGYFIIAFKSNFAT